MTQTMYGHVQESMLRREQHRENSGRFGTQYVTYETAGSGELLPVDPIIFDMPFFTEPIVTYGHVLAKFPDREAFYLPVPQVGVVRWELNRRGFWIGAYIYVRVGIDLRPGGAPSEPADPVIHHHLTFTGESYKAMSDDVNESAADDAVMPLTPPVMP